MGGKSGVPVSFLSRFQFISMCCLLWVKALLGEGQGESSPLEGRVSLPLFQAGKADKRQWTRVCPAEKEGGAGGAGLGQEAWKIPFDPLRLEGKLAYLASEAFCYSISGAPQSKHNQVYVLTALLYRVCSFQIERKGRCWPTLRSHPHSSEC